MTIASLAGDGATLSLLGRMVLLTLFYAALSWLPLRGTAAVVRRVQSRQRPRKPSGRAEPPRTDDSWVIR